MIYYLLVPILSLVLLVLQTTVLNLFFLGKMGLEISLILIIYAGFRLDALRGGLFAFVMGFLLDCITGSAAGFFTLYYVVVFFVSRALSFTMYAERHLFIMAFTFACAFSEGIFITLIYGIFYDVDIFANIYKIFLIQALAVGALSPLLFSLFGRLEEVFDVRESR